MALIQMLLVHGRISSENQVNVSPDCHVKVIHKTENGIEYSEFVKDTSPLHEQFKLMESQ
ncbi:hypothetical protein [Gracilibacillus thailandensis]|uniref:Uncharacterized protein n=1 Tax=Gracilibacillus thailandensis TaxID=563735 RepID=A0A6N7QWV5_9BACI|nr:hypothetical protein [Gracilibacillus thailandensis]MRI65210.1 hypothetical protein [Gracilibacillus thailandensis]